MCERDQQCRFNVFMFFLFTNHLFGKISFKQEEGCIAVKLLKKRKKERETKDAPSRLHQVISACWDLIKEA